MPPNQQTPSQVPPDPNMPPAQPIRRTVIQPLSSEDEIRQAAASSGASARPPESSTGPVSAYPSGTVEAGPVGGGNTYEGGLITEPLHQPNQAPSQYNRLQTPAPGVTAITKAKKSPAKAIAIMLLIGVLGAAAWLFFFNRISSADLVQESVSQSTYLRPKQWPQLSPSVSAYGNMTEEDGDSTALVSVAEFPATSSRMFTGTEESYDRYRKLLMEQFSEDAVRLIMSTNAPMGCRADDIDVTQHEEDTDKNKTTVGLMKAAASCQKGVNTITMKMRLVAGANDERVRMIIVGGTAVDWIKNGQSFQRMLDGVEERATAT